MSEITFTRQIGHYLFDDFESDGTYEFTVELDEDGFSLTSLVLRGLDIAGDLTREQECVTDGIIRDELWRQDFDECEALAIQRHEDWLFNRDFY